MVPETLCVFIETEDTVWMVWNASKFHMPEKKISSLINTKKLLKHGFILRNIFAEDVVLRV